jgi:hypothetical protein
MGEGERGDEADAGTRSCDRERGSMGAWARERTRRWGDAGTRGTRRDRRIVIANWLVREAIPARKFISET